MVPGFQTFFLPILRALSDGKEQKASTLRDQIAKQLELSQADLAERLPSGKQTYFHNRNAWAVTYLVKAGLLERPNRGNLRITDAGKVFLKANPDSINVKVLKSIPEFSAFHGSSASAAKDDRREPEEDEILTPQEQLATSYQALRSGLIEEILQQVLKCSPAFFEDLVIDVLLRMGYGGNRKDAGQAVGRTGDGGIDGIIKEDRLGLDVVYVQAKRWEGSVGEPEIHKFAGSLDKRKARKGIFITTSRFTAAAMNYVREIEKRIVLIDGASLAELMIDHNVGVAEVESYSIKRLDSDYFQE